MGIKFLYFKPPLNFLGIDSFNKLEESKFVVIPVPFDSTESYKSGQREAPLAIIKASYHIDSLFDPRTGEEAYKKGVYTTPEIEVVRGDVEKTLKRIEEVVKEVVSLNKIPILLGGEHTISLGALRALSKDVCFVSLDAHADLRDELEGSKVNYGTFVRRIVEEGRKVVEIGVRSISKDEFEFSQGVENLKIFYKWDFNEDFTSTLKKVIEEIQGKKVYLSIDFDVLDPSLAKSVAHPEPDGFSWNELIRILNTVASTSKIVGFDVVEIIPDGLGEELAAKLIYKLISWI